MADQPLFPGLNASSSGHGTVAAVDVAIPDLFGEPSTDSSNESEPSKVVNAVVSQSNASNERVLGPKPHTSSALEFHTSSPFSWGSILVKVALILAVAVFAFLYSQLQTRFELPWKNPAQQLNGLESSIDAEQTTLNRYHWTLANFALDDFSVLADHYLYQVAQYESPWTSRNTKLALEEDLRVSNEAIKASLLAIQENISQPLYPEGTTFGTLTLPELEQHYKDLLIQDLELKKQDLLTKAGGPYTADIANFDSVENLLNHQAFQNAVLSADLSGELSPDLVEDLFRMSMEVSESQFLTVLTIKNSRTHWTYFLQNIDAITSTVDPLYGSDLLSYIDYSSVSLDAKNRSVMLRGTARTDDSLNFSMISNLIDAFEESPLFMNVSTRTFSKSEDSDEGYSAQFTLSMNLEADAEIDIAVETETEEVPALPAEATNS